jgi:DNA-directed RNA polymerase specialized sigma24 family protein
MECAVEQISRYLDRKGQPLFSKEIRWLLLTAFRRVFRRYAKKQERLKPVADISLLRDVNAQDDWEIRANGHLDLTKILERLSPRGCTVLALRLAGFRWREIADSLGMSEAAARRSFWREIRRVQSSVPGKPKPGSEVV